MRTASLPLPDPFRRPAAPIGTSQHGPVRLCGVTRRTRVASAFARAGIIRIDVCGRPAGHRGEHRG